MMLVLAMAAGAAEPPPPKPPKIDVAALFEGIPANGERRCRSRRPDVVYITRGYTGGAAPPPGMVVQSSRLIVDRVEVGTARRVVGEPAWSSFAIEWGAPSKVKAARRDGDVEETRYDVVISRTDGEPIAGKPALAVTWTCQHVRYPPLP